MDILLIRHGKTPGNSVGQYVGSTDQSLCESGVIEIQGYAGRYPAVDYIFASPMKRALETKDLIYLDIPFETMADLRECCFGIFEGKTYDELKDSPHYQAWIDCNATIPEGESFGGFNKRVQTAFAQAVENAFVKGFSTIAIVAHGGTIMSIMDQFSGDDHTYFDFQVGNGKGFSLSVSREYWQAHHCAENYAPLLQ